jgi:uncharacterized membrane protein
MNHRILLGWILASLAFIGMIDSGYMAFNSLMHFIVPCGIAKGCDEVLNSPYARIRGISIAWGGLAFYFSMAFGGIFAAYGFDRILRLTLPIAILAFVFTLYLLYLQAFVILAFCDYCLLSALLVTLSLILHVVAKAWKKVS